MDDFGTPEHDSNTTFSDETLDALEDGEGFEFDEETE